MLDEAEQRNATCVFCRRADLSHILHETEHFLVLADHAPVVEGHLLILPRAHYACYGALPAALDDEFLGVKSRVTAFCQTTYQPPVFFEHGVYHQSVFHAHLHAIPLGSFPVDISDLAALHGTPILTQEDVRAWYASRGHYFYLERLIGQRPSSEAIIFPPEGALYRRVLGLLREQTGEPGGWLPQPVRRLTGSSKIRSLAGAWQRYAKQ